MEHLDQPACTAWSGCALSQAKDVGTATQSACPRVVERHCAPISRIYGRPAASHRASCDRGFVHARIWGREGPQITEPSRTSLVPLPRRRQALPAQHRDGLLCGRRRKWRSVQRVRGKRHMGTGDSAVGIEPECRRHVPMPSGLHRRPSFLRRGHRWIRRARSVIAASRPHAVAGRADAAECADSEPDTISDAGDAGADASAAHATDAISYPSTDTPAYSSTHTCANTRADTRNSRGVPFFGATRPQEPPQVYGRHIVLVGHRPRVLRRARRAVAVPAVVSLHVHAKDVWRRQVRALLQRRALR